MPPKPEYQIRQGDGRSVILPFEPMFQNASIEDSGGRCCKASIHELSGHSTDVCCFLQVGKLTVGAHREG